MKKINEFGETFYSIPATFKKYKGCGYALAAINADDEITDLIYIRDILPDVDLSEESGFDLKSIIDEPHVGLAAIQLEQVGQVSLGMVSCYEFIVM